MHLKESRIDYVPNENSYYYQLCYIFETIKTYVIITK